MSERGEQREPAPEERAQNDDELARIAVGQRTDKRRSHHVETQKCAGKIANLRLGKVELVLHQWLHREQHVAVRIVEQIERREYDQRRAWLQFRGGHGVERI